jgi:hypothetical protein
MEGHLAIYGFMTFFLCLMGGLAVYGFMTKRRRACRFVVSLALYFSVLSLYAAFLQFTSVSQINMRTLCSGKFEQRRGDGAALPRAEGNTCTKLHVMLCFSSHSHTAA